VVWSVKYRRKILSPEIEEYLKRLVHQIAEENIRRYIEHQSKSY
jgi:REP element-mobilizing transposase RayT